MRKWGLVVSAFYALVVFALVGPATLFLGFYPRLTRADFLGGLKETYSSWFTWLLFGVIVLGEVILLWLSVDTTQKRLRPRTHILVSAVAAGLLLAVLTLALLLAVAAAVWGDNLDRRTNLAEVLSAFFVPWLLWAIVFRRVARDAGDAVSRAVSWLLRGSVLELLIAVPSHVIVRRRADCSAPAVTGYGIATGLSIMLLSFGPSVLLLYKKRIKKDAAWAAAR